jgi:hypothetical protein
MAQVETGELVKVAADPDMAVISIDPASPIKAFTCPLWQQPDYCQNLPLTDDPNTKPCKVGCKATPMSLLAAPGRYIGAGLKKVFTSQDIGQLEMTGHIATALILIGGTVYLFTRGK